MKLFLIAALCAASVAHAQTTWKLASGYRAESFHTENLAQFGRDVEAATGNKLKFELAPNGSLFKLNDIRQAVQAVPWPPQGLYSIRPIRSAADFKSMKMRTYNQTTVRIAEMLGATPVDVPMVDVGNALSEGRMDGMITSAVTGVENKVWGHIKYYYEINAWFPKNIVFVNAKSFDALSPEARATVLSAAAKAETRGWLTSEAVAASSTKELQSNGIKIERLSSDLETDIKRLGERFSGEWVRSVGHAASDIFVPYYFN